MNSTADIAHPQIRNRGTFGGSLAHADPAAELPALAVVLQAEMRVQRLGSRAEGQGSGDIEERIAGSVHRLVKSISTGVPQQ